MDASNEPHPTNDPRHTERPLVGPDRRQPRVRLDLTINIPTMISLTVLTVTVSAAVVGIYNTIDRRQMAADFLGASQSQRIDKVEASLAALKTDHAAQNAAIRGEMKSDISEIKDLLNRLIFTPVTSQQQQRQLREWSK